MLNRQEAYPGDSGPTNVTYVTVLDIYRLTVACHQSFVTMRQPGHALTLLEGTSRNVSTTLIQGGLRFGLGPLASPLVD